MAPNRGPWLRPVPNPDTITHHDASCADCGHRGLWRPENGTVEHRWGTCRVRNVGVRAGKVAA